MERKNKDKNPVYNQNYEDLDKPMSVLINEIRNELSKTRGKLHDIKFSYGWDDRIQIYEGGITCIISALANLQDDFKKIENEELTHPH